MKLKKRLFAYGIDFLYLLGGLIVLGAGIYIAYFGVGLDNDGDALTERISLSVSLIVSGFLYLRYAFHLNYPNNYTRAALLLILASFIPYLNFAKVSFNGDMNSYLLEITAVFGFFIFLLVSSLVLLFIGYMKGRTNLENEITQPVNIK